MEKLTISIEKTQYQINRDAVRLLVTMGVLVEVVAPVTEPPPIIAPPKPDAIVPKPVETAKAVPESDFLGEQIEPNLFRMKGQDCSLLRAKGKLWPRDTVTNRNPEGTVGVPLRFTLPPGWYWEIAESGDGAWAIVPYPTAQLGPEWLRKTTTSPALSVSTTDQSGEQDTTFLTAPQQ